MKRIYLLVFLMLILISDLFAANRVINLVVGYKKVCFAGKPSYAIAVNNQIPAPTLHFKEGDHVTINVLNKLNEETAIHWHGILVPWQMDGVLGVSQRGIQPNQSFHYKFTLHQAGTYWYHAHAGLQEQQGLYGAFLIDPKLKPSYRYTKDYVIVLSDWSNIHPNQILANLKKEGDYYSPRFPLQPSLAKFIHDYKRANAEERKKLIADYKMMQQMRMGIYDISDVAFDAFLLNGQTKKNPWQGIIKPGDIVRLRFIGAAGTTIFQVKIPGTTMQMIHVQGNDVQLYTINDFRIAPGETYDVLIKIQKKEPYIIYAESGDALGMAYGILVTKPNQFVNLDAVTPFPEPLPVTREMMDKMMMTEINPGAMNMDVSNMQQEMPHTLKMSMHTSTMKTEEGTTHEPMSSMKKGLNEPVSDHPLHTKMSEKQLFPRTPDSMQMHHDMSEMNVTMDHFQHQRQDMQNYKDTSPSKVNHNLMQMDHDFRSSITKNQSTEKSNSIPVLKTNNMHNLTVMHRSIDHNKYQKFTKLKLNQQMSAMKSKNMSMHHKHYEMMKKMQHSMAMDHEMHMPTESTIIGDTIALPSAQKVEMTTPGTKYANIIAKLPTNDPDKPVKAIIRMELFGYMDRFIWFINGLPEYKAKPIVLKPGKRYRIVFTNTSMMHHPMHMHGHWFILRKGLGIYDPLLHTLDVPPGATMVVDVDTDASGQWFFHCHLLYHMVAGMSRIFQYSTLLEITKNERTTQNIVEPTKYYNRPIVRFDEAIPIDTALVKHPIAHAINFYFANFLDIGVDPFKNIQKGTFKGLYGQDYDKLELLTEDAEVKKGKIENADIDIFYWRLISQFWIVKGGFNYFYRPAIHPYWQPGIGIEGLMPYFIDTDLRGYFYSGSAKLDAEFLRDTQLTNNFFIRLGIRSILASKTVARGQIGSGLNQMRYTIRPYYRLMPGLNIFAEYEYEKDYGVFKNLQVADGEPSTDNNLTVGLSFVF